MDPCRLVREELEYECKIRGIAHYKGATVVQMRSWVAEFLKREDSGKIAVDCKVHLDAAEEINACQDKVDALRERIRAVVGPRDSNECKHIETKLMHLLGRVTRIERSDEYNKVIKTLTEDIYNLEEMFDANIDKTNMPETIVSVEPVVAESSSAPITTVVQRKQIPVSQWGLKFSGDQKGMSINAFLLRVDEFRVAKHVSSQELFESAFELLSGSALIYFRAIRSRISTWEELAMSLKDEYQPFDYEIELWREIRNRVQGPNERVGIFIACMENLFARLPNSPAESEKLAILKRNIAPYLIRGIGLHEITSLAELLKACKVLEANNLLAQKGRSIPVNNVMLLEPDLADNSAVMRAYAVDHRPNIVDDVEPRERKCWNCSSSQHLFSRCSRPLRDRFCFTCGKRNVTRRTCSNCNSGNGLQGGRFNNCPPALINNR